MPAKNKPYIIYFQFTPPRNFVKSFRVLSDFFSSSATKRQQKKRAKAPFLLASAAGLSAQFVTRLVVRFAHQSVNKFTPDIKKLSTGNFFESQPSRVRAPKLLLPNKKTTIKVIFLLASAAGLEPTTHSLGNCCSILMSYADIV